MLYGLERELSDGEAWSLGQQSKLPIHLQLLAEQEQGRRDIWKLPDKQSDNKPPSQQHHPQEEDTCP